MSSRQAEVSSELILEFTRAEKAEEPHGFRFEAQDYRLRLEGGGVRSARFPWGERLLADLQALSRESPDPEVARRLGEHLRRFLDELDWGGREQALEGVGRTRGAPRVVLRSAAAELYALPWELVTLKDSGQHLAELPGFTLRYEWPGSGEQRAREAAPRGGRVLLAWSAAGGLVPMEGHLRVLQRASQEGDVPFDMQRDVLPRASLSGLEERLKGSSEPVSVLHVLCHGAALASSASRQYGLAWNEPGGGAGVELVDGGALGAVLAPHAGTLRLVVLCACHGGDGGELASHLGSVAQALHRAGIEMVVASRLPLSSAGSVLLAETLYEKLLVESCSLEEALEAARRRLRVAGAGFDWASLQLYARREEGADLRPVVLRPYRGLLAFEPRHRRFFFGRSRLEAALLERVRQAVRGERPRFQVVAGASGAGKSSVVLAGLVPLLPEEEWDWRVVRPGELVRSGSGGSGERSATLGALRHVLHGVAFSEPLREGVEASQEEVVEEVCRLRRARPGRKLLLVVDQLEEVFTQLPAETRQSLLRTLWELTRREELACVVVGTLRVDHFERCGEVLLDDRTRLDTIVYAEEHRLFVAQLGPEELVEAIEQPARKVGLELEPGLVDRLCADVGQEPGALPLLGHALDLLWQRREGRRLGHRAYEEMGGVAGALTGTAETLYEALSEGERAQARRLLVRLVAERSMASARARARVWVEEVRPGQGVEREAFEAVLEKLVGHRLLVKGGEAGRGAWVQLAHETLLRRWKRLEAWLAEDWEREQQLRELEEWAEDWEARLGGADGGASYLLMGDRLGYARGLREKHGEELSPRSRRLLEASLAAEERRQEEEKEAMRVLAEARARAARFFRAGFAITGVLLVVALAAVIVVSRLRRQEQEQRKVAQSTARILLAERLRKQDPNRALLVLREVDHYEKDPRWLATVLDTFNRPMEPIALLRVHGNKVSSVAFSPDGTRLVTSSYKGAQVWSADGAPQVELPGRNGGAVTSVAFSPDGQRVVTGSTDWTALVWNLKGEQLAKLQHADMVTSVAFSPDGTRVMTGSYDNTARVWSLEGKLLAELKEHGRVTAVAFSPDGQRVVTASEDDKARVWSTEGTLLKVLEGHDGQVRSVAFSPDGQRVVTASEDGGLRVWSLEGTLLAKLETGGGTVRSVAFSPDGQRLVTGSADHKARVWSTEGTLLVELKGHEDEVTSAAFSPDGQRVVTASEDETVRVWSVVAGMMSPLGGHRGGVRSVAFSPKGTHVVTTSEAKARVWNAEGKPLGVLNYDYGEVGSAAFSPDGQRVVTAWGNGGARVWSLDGKVLMELAGGWGTSAAFSPDGQRVVVAFQDGTARVWSAEGELRVELAKHEGAVTSVAFSPDGQRLVTASKDGTARVWNSKGWPLVELKGHEGEVTSAAFSPDGQRVLTASLDGSARVWSLEGKPLVELRGHKGAVTSAAYSPDGQRLVTSSADGTARVWSAEGALQWELAGHEDVVTSAAFSPDGTRVMTASLDGAARMWPLNARLMRERLESAALGCLTHEERQSWLDETPEEARSRALRGHTRGTPALRPPLTRTAGRCRATGRPCPRAATGRARPGARGRGASRPGCARAPR